MIREHILDQQWSRWAAALVLAATSAHGADGRQQPPLADRRHRSHHLPHQRARRGHRSSAHCPPAMPWPDSGNIAVPTLAGMMLDRGTKTLDKFAIADKLDSVGAEISFTVGDAKSGGTREMLEEGPAAGAQSDRRGASGSRVVGRRVRQGQAAVHRLAAAIAAEHRPARPGSVRARDVSGRPSEPSARDRGISGRGQGGDARGGQGVSRQVLWSEAFTLVLVGDVSADETDPEIGKDFSGWSGGQDYLRPASPARPSGPREISVPLSREAEHLGDLGAGDGPALSRSGRTAAPGRDGDSRPGLHRPPDGHGARPRRAHLSNRRRHGGGQHRRRRVEHLRELRPRASRAGHRLDAPRARPVVAGGCHRRRTQLPARKGSSAPTRWACRRPAGSPAPSWSRSQRGYDVELAGCATPRRSRRSRAIRSTARSTRGSTRAPWCSWRRAASHRHRRRALGLFMKDSCLILRRRIWKGIFRAAVNPLRCAVPAPRKPGVALLATRATHASRPCFSRPGKSPSKPGSS